jgi:predicted nucleic acid-binding protein
LAEADSPIVLDTDVASLSQKGRLGPGGDSLLGRTWCVSFVTVGELAAGAAGASWGLRKWTDLAEWLRDVVILPYDVQVSYTWGQLAAAARRRARPRPVNDMWIAAVCLTHGLPLATRNVKDFTDFVDHHGLVLLPT